jgi:hypothetical protein
LIQIEDNDMVTNLLESLSDHVVVSDAHVEQTVKELRDADNAISQYADFSKLLLEEGPVIYVENGNRQAAFLEFKKNGDGLFLYDSVPLLQSRAVTSARQKEIDAIINIVQNPNPKALAGLINDQISIRQRDLVQLRRLMCIHQTAIQNAVDIVQTKRIDFLEEKEDTWTDGVFGALFFAVVFTLFPVEAVAAQLLGKLAQVVTRVFGARIVSDLFKNTRTSMQEHIGELEKSLDVLRKAATKSRKELRKGFPLAERQEIIKASQGLKTKTSPLSPQGANERIKELQETIKGLEIQLDQSKENEKQYLDFTVNAAAQLFQRLPGKSISVIFGRTVEETAFNSTTNVQSGVEKSLQDTSNPPTALSGIPLDIAIKEQVQGLYASFVFTAEDVIATLEVFRDNLPSQTPSDKTLAELWKILVSDSSNPTNDNQNDVKIGAQDVQQQIVAATAIYEQSIWILMYGNQVIERTKTEYVGLDLDGHHVQELAQPADSHVHLLRYLHSRFYPEKDIKEIGLGYESLYRTIIDRKLPEISDRFVQPNQILDLIKNVALRPVRFGKVAAKSDP